MPHVNDISLNEFIRNRLSGLEPIVAEVVTELLELRALKESVEPCLEWVEGRKGTCILKINEVEIGLIFPVPQDYWCWNASLEPKTGLPYQLEGMTQNERPSLEVARVECEQYVREHLVRTQVTCHRKDPPQP